MTANKIILPVIFLCTLCFCIWRDIQLEKQYTGDLRNRIVGARLQKDGRLPYFYKWKPQDGLRYYDPQNFDTLQVANITATPFLHQLITPLADKPQRSVSKTWLALEYSLLLITLAFSFSFAKTKLSRWAIVIITFLFLLTSGWKGHIAAGQYYILIPTLMMLFYYFISRKKYMLHAVIAAILAAGLVLARPNTFIFFLPFLFLWKGLPRKYSLTFIITALAVIAVVFASEQNRLLWSDFRGAMSEQMKSHQELHPATHQNAEDPHFTQWEGWDKDHIAKDAEAYPVHFQSEHGNLFVIAKHLFGTIPPVWLSTMIMLLLMTLAAFIFYKKKVKNAVPSLCSVALLGSCLYMISDLCSPFYRFQYNAVQWLFPLLLVASHFHRRYTKAMVLIVIGLLLNIIEISGIPFEHTIGEYFILAGLLLLTYIYPHA